MTNENNILSALRVCCHDYYQESKTLLPYYVIMQIGYCPPPYVICPIYSIPLFPYFVTLNYMWKSQFCTSISPKVRTTSISVFGEWLFRWQALIGLKVQNPNFSLHAYFNKLNVISVETLMNVLKYLSNYCKKMHAGLTFQHSCRIPTEVFKQQP